MAVTVTRRSFLRNCELVEEQVGSTIYTYWDAFEPPVIAPQDGDLQHYATSSDRLDTISVKYYGTPHLWWVVALANDLDDPVSALHLGKLLTIPNPRYILETVTQ